jgi:excisionase family DNA binding protein
LRPEEVAARLGLSRRTVVWKIRRGQLPAYQLGGPGSAIRVDPAEIERWLQSRRGPGEPPLPGAVEAAVNEACHRQGNEFHEPYDLLALRHPDSAKAQERHLRALEQQRAAEERVQALELAAAEEDDRLTLGNALVDQTTSHPQGRPAHPDDLDQPMS